MNNAIDLTFSQEILAQILAHVGNVGWDSSCWSDDNLSSKKLYPSFSFPSKSKKWAGRLKVTDESMGLFVQRVQTVHEQCQAWLKKKKDTSTMEAFAERAAALWRLGKEVCVNTP